MKTRNKALVLTLCAVLLVVATVMGTLAYLTDKSETYINSFTVGSVKVKLEETTGTEYKMVPGYTIKKDPKVTAEGSEDCYLFVKVVPYGNVAQYMDYDIADGWMLVPGETYVYYREVLANATEKSFDVLKDNKLTVKESLTADDMKDAVGINKPTLKIQAFACQLYSDGINKMDVATAWKNAQGK